MKESVQIPADSARREALFDRAKKKAEENGFVLAGDVTAGTFSGDTLLGRVEGTYRTDSLSVHITVTERGFVPEGLLRDALRNLFSEEHDD